MEVLILFPTHIQLNLISYHPKLNNSNLAIMIINMRKKEERREVGGEGALLYIIVEMKCAYKSWEMLQYADDH